MWFVWFVYFFLFASLLADLHDGHIDPPVFKDSLSTVALSFLNLLSL